MEIFAPTKKIIARGAPPGRPGVSRSLELLRVKDLPRRAIDIDEAVAEALSLAMVRPGSQFRFRVNQAVMLLEAVENDGLISFDAVGCVRASTRVLTSQGEIRIDQLKAGSLVASAGPRGWQWARCNAPFVKGRARLVLVRTARGEFVAHEKHLIALSDGNWRYVRDLQAGQSVLSYLQSPARSTWGSSLLVSTLGAYRLKRTLVDSQAHYSDGFRQCDHPPHSQLEGDLVSVRERGDEEVRNRNAERDRDNFSADELERNRRDRSDDLRANSDCVGRSVARVRVAEDSLFEELPERSQLELLNAPLFQQQKDCRPLSVESLRDQKVAGDLSSSFPCLTGYNDIILEVKQLKSQEDFWDVEIPETGNYVAEGFVHHNSGKTTVCPFFGKMFGFERVVILCPATMRHELEGRLIPRLRKEVDFTPPIVISYSQLQDARFDDILEKANPQLVVADEFHYLKNDNAARTMRFDRFFESHPDCVLVAMSGTGMRNSILDFWPMIQRTHRGRKTPMTRSWSEAQDWSLALDPGVRPDERIAPGALMEFTRPGEDAREGFSRRLFDTAGVVGKNEGVDCDARLIFRPLRLECPVTVEQVLEQLRNAWELPDGELIVDSLDFWRRSRQVAQGFYYKWRWPNGVVDEEWMDARKAWRQAVVSVTKLNRPRLDSELLVRNAAERESNLEGYDGDAARLPEASRKKVLKAYADWKPQMDKDEPPTEAVWIDDFMARAAIAWEPETFGIVWCDSRALRAKIAELDPSGYHVGPNEAEKLRALDPKEPPELWRSLTQSHRKAYVTMAYHYGKNLQRAARNLVTCWAPSGATLEQLSGRTHRSLQEADEVIVEYYAHTDELRDALAKSIEQAIALEKTTGAQRLLIGEWPDGRPEPKNEYGESE